jgi:hypothetical protein
MKTIILALLDALHGRKIKNIRHHCATAEETLNKHVRKNEEDEVYKHYRKEMIEIINLTNRIKGCLMQIDDDTDAE